MSMSNRYLLDSEMSELFGGPVGDILVNTDAIEVHLALCNMRNMLAESAQIQQIGIDELACRLKIHPSSVARFMCGDSDVRLSTIILYGRALGMRWTFSLEPDKTWQSADRKIEK